MPGWGKLIAGAVIGAAGALYATNEELRKGLPGTARDLPEAVRRRFEAAAAAAREASALRRAEILKDLEAHGAKHAGRRTLGATASPTPVLPDPEAGTPTEAPSPPEAARRADNERTQIPASTEE